MEFFGLEFNPIEMSDKPVLEPILREFPKKLAGYTFASVYAWAKVYEGKWCKVNQDFVLIIWNFPKKQNRIFFAEPIGNFSKEAQEVFLNTALQSKEATKITGVTTEFCQNHPEFIKNFKVKNNRGGANYIYLAEDLAFLKGHKYSKKRNLLAQARKLFSWEVVPMTSNCGPECLKILEELAYPEIMELSLQQEKEALRATMEHFHDLDQKGIMIRIDGKPVAFSVYEGQGHGIAVVHFEKALRQYKGLYQVITQETAKRILDEGYKFINLEEDMGDEGLRQSKLSYFPLEIAPNYSLVFYKNII